MKNTSVLLLGGGKIGQMIAHLLSNSGSYKVSVADCDPQALEKFKAMNVNTILTDITDAESLMKSAKGFQYLLSACPFSLTPVIASVAKAVGAH